MIRPHLVDPRRARRGTVGLARLAAVQITAAVSAVLLGSAFGIGAAAAVDLPKQKPGLWESTITSGAPAGQPARVQAAKVCLDAATQRELVEDAQGMASSACRKTDLRPDGPNRFVIETDCKMDQTRMRSRSLITFSGDSAYRIEVAGTFDPPMMGMKESRTVVESRHVGACPADMKPGDMVIPGMPPFNIRQKAAAAAAAAGAASGAPKK